MNKALVVEIESIKLLIVNSVQIILTNLKANSRTSQWTFWNYIKHWKYFWKQISCDATVHDKKDGGMLISETVLCEFKSVAITFKKYLTRVWYEFYPDLFSIKFCAFLHNFWSNCFCPKNEVHCSPKAWWIDMSMFYNVVFVSAHKSRAGYKHQISSKESQSSINWCDWKVLKPFLQLT